MNDIAPLKPTEPFLRAAQELGIAFDHGELEKLGRYLALMLDTNTRVNLTAITEPADAWMRHNLDSLTLLPFLVQAEAKTVIDVGSGGGAPGIPLAIALPDVEFTLLEATGKKVAFLEMCVEALGLRNVRVVNDRAETAGAKDSPLRGRFDVAIARALGPLPVLLELTVPFVKVSGFLLAVKGARADAEIREAKQALHMLHCEVANVHETLTSRIVVVEKLRATPGKYPRSPGEPKRSPLGTTRP